MWSRNGKYYQVADEVVRGPLPAGFYQLNFGRAGMALEVSTPTADELIPMADSVASRIVAEVTDFAGKKALYEKYGYTHKHAYLLHGPGGTGKTSTLVLAARALVEKHNAIIINRCAADLGHWAMALRALRQAEPDRLIAFFLEDYDRISRYPQVLALLEGEDTVPGVVYLATTNYINQCSPQSIRSGRFDTKIFVDVPSLGLRTEYLKRKFLGADAKTIARWAEDTQGFNLADLKVLIQHVVLHGRPYETELSEMRQNLKLGLGAVKEQSASAALKKMIIDAADAIYNEGDSVEEA